MQVKKSSRILTIFINGRVCRENTSLYIEISQFMNILELNTRTFGNFEWSIFITIQKILQNLFICWKQNKNKNRDIRQGGEKEGFGPESSNSHLQGFQTKAQIKRNDA